MRLTSSVSVAQTIIALSSVELTSILVPSHRLRIMALLSSGCRATVDGLTNVQGSSTTQQWQATSLDDNNLHVPCRQSSKHFISGQLKVIPLFRYSVIPYSAFYSIPVCMPAACIIKDLTSDQSFFPTIYPPQPRLHPYNGRV